MKRPALKVLWVLSCLTLLWWAGASQVGALESNVAPVSVDRVDATGNDLVVDVATAEPGATKSLKVTVGDKVVTPSSVEPLASILPSDVAVVIDNSAALGNGPVQIAKTAVSGLQPAGVISSASAVTAGGIVTTVSSATTSPGSFTNSLQSVGPSDGGALLWDAADRALDLLGDREPTQRNLVLYVGSPDVGSQVSLAQLGDRLTAENVRVHVIALAGATPDIATLQQIVLDHGGTFQAGSSDDLTTMTATVTDHLSRQYRMVVPGTTVADGQLGSLRVEWNGAATKASYRPGVVSSGWKSLRPAADNSSTLDNLLDRIWVKWLLVALVAAAAMMAAYAVISLVVRSNDGIDFALRHYDGYVIDDLPGQDDDMSSSLAKTEILKRAVAFTGSLAERQGVLTRVEELLERADLPLRPAEALFFYVAVAVAAVIGSFFFFDSFLVAIAVVICALLLPNFYVGFRAKRRKKKFVRQLPDMLQLLAGTLRAGYSVSQGFEAVSREIEDPMGRELRRVMTEARLGRLLEDALDATGRRMQSEDFEWAVMAIRIQREVGGNLAELLMTVSDTMTQRERLRRDVAALTAEGRMSAIVLGCLPPGLALVMYVMNPTYIGRLFQDTVGIGMLVGAVLMMLIGFVWMKKVITIEI